MMSNRFMQLAIAEAEKGVQSDDGGPFGAVIVKDGVVIASAHNEVVKTNDPTAHAEILAIRQASAVLEHFHLKSCTLYCTGEPCPMCFAAIHWAHIEKVVYCMTKGDAEKIGFDDTLITKIMTGQEEDPVMFVHRPEALCQKLYTEWFVTPQKTLY